MPCRNPRRLYIHHLAFTYSIGPLIIGCNELGTGSAFSTNESAWSVIMVMGSQSRAWSGPKIVLVVLLLNYNLESFWIAPFGLMAEKQPANPKGDCMAPLSCKGWGRWFVPRTFCYLKSIQYIPDDGVGDALLLPSQWCQSAIITLRMITIFIFILRWTH